MYNTVNVTIENGEFGTISTKEGQVAQYLDMLHTVKVTDYTNIDDHLSLAHVAKAGKIDVESTVNNQDSKTPIFLEEQGATLKLA